MRTTALENAMRHAPFRSFAIHSDGRVVAVDHPEQIWLSPDKSTAIVGTPDGQIIIIDVDRISSITLKKRPAKARQQSEKSGES